MSIFLNRRAATSIVALLVLPLLCVSADDPVKVGVEKRPSWTTSRITGSPEPPLPYVAERAFGALTFDKCLDIVQPANSERFFIAEQGGKIFSFPNRPDVEKADLVVDIAKEIEGVKHVYAITFHPKFEDNRFCYVCYIKEPNLEDGTHVARFRVSETDPPTIDVATETTIITWPSGGHNGCCLKFGPDGYLYISTGDGVGPNPPDIKKTGQDISDLLSSILRIDVDQSDEDKNYRIPSDNPFVEREGARGEIWAYGFRNPWRMSFDRKTGDFWVGDVGWELWELLDRVERGGNYGWGVMEGRQPTNPEWPRGPTPILPPTIDHPHTESSSITDGLTYYGSRLKKLHGMHIYGDYDTGKFWGFRWQDGKVVDHQELADTTLRVVGFGEASDGEFYVLDHTAGTIHRLVPNPKENDAGKFPRKLSETGLFSSVADEEPAPGVVPYYINAEPWADHAFGQRWVAVPNDGKVKAAAGKWSFPKGTVLVKTLYLMLEPLAVPYEYTQIETQILHFDGSEWQPYTYRWNDEQTDAMLVGVSGAEKAIERPEFSWESPRGQGELPAIGKRQQTWRFVGRAECQRCHNKWSGPVLGFNTAQLNRLDFPEEKKQGQLERFVATGLIDKPIAPKDRVKLARVDDRDASIDDRARAYLDVNCAHCHRLHAGGAVLAKLHHDVPLDQMNIVGARPTQGTFGIHGAQVVAPGDPFRSVLLYRMAKLGGGRMPHIGSSEVDRRGARLIEQWIRQLPKQATKDKTGEATADRLHAANARDAVELVTTANEDAINRLLLSTSGALMLLRVIDEGGLRKHTQQVVIARATAHEDVRVRDLFERFLPPAKRSKRLGSVVDALRILSLPGDAGRGKEVFSVTAGVSCKNCHRIGDDGPTVGPELTAIGKKLDRAQLLESILEPSKRIDPAYVTYLVETKDGRLLTGLLVKKDDDEVVLRDAENKLARIPAEEIEQLVRQQRSLMPDLLVRDLTAEQLADLLAYLSSLK